MEKIGYRNFSDHQLASLLIRHDHAAFTEIFNRYNTLLYLHAYNKLRNDHEARDVVQELFIKLWDKRESVNDKHNLSGYLYRSVMNLIFNHLKHKKVVSVYAREFGKMPNNYEGADFLVREKQLAEYIAIEIENLPPRMRAVFNLRHREQMSNKEVAEQLQIAESTVADQMKKALKILRGRMGTYFFI